MKRWILAWIGLCMCGAFAMSSGGASEQPNILFIMSDDHTSQAVGVYNSRLAALNPTPTLDQLAEDGVVMENAFCPNAICVPSRASILTGQHSAVNGVPTLNEALPVERHYLTHEMKRAGYQTAIIGKWHLKVLPTSFDYYKVLKMQGDYFDPIFLDMESTNTVFRTYTQGDRTWRAAFENAVQMKGHSTDRITDIALDWFKNKRDPEQPFFLKLHYKAPHDYFEYATRYESYLADVEIPEPENMWDLKENGSIATRGLDDTLTPYIGTSVGRRNLRRNYAEDPATPWADQIDHSLDDDAIKRQAYQLYMKAYLRCVKGVDDNVARVINYLKAEGLYENTVIIYTGDQGFYLGEHDYIDKRWGYEEGMRMPFIISYPKAIKGGVRSDAIVENVDYAPTMLDYAGVPTPDYMHGRSFRSILESGREPSDWKKAAYYHYWMHMAHHDNPAHIGIRTKRYKLLFFYGTGWNGETEPDTPPAWELYDLEKDPNEDYNVYDDPAYAGAVQELKSSLKALRAEYGEDDPKFAFNQVIDDYWAYDANDRKRARMISPTVLEKHQNGTWPHNQPRKKMPGKAVSQ